MDPPLVGPGFSNYEYRGEWSTLTLGNPLTGVSHSTHRYPLDKFIHTLDKEGSCMCGPHVVVMIGENDERIPMYTHVEWDFDSED